MDDVIGNYEVWAPTLMLVAVRLGGIFMVAPVFSHSSVPVKLRLLGAMVISLAVVARMVHPAPVPSGAADLLLTAAGELLIGAGIGYAARLVFVAVELGAFHVAQQMGLALGEVFNPQARESHGAVRSLFTMFTIAIFLLIGGHRALIVAVTRTFQIVPPVPGITAGTLLGTIVTLLGASFALALKIAAPVLITMLLATVAMGMLQKTLPQCNLLTTHLPIRAMLGVVMLAAAIGVIAPLLDAAVTHLTDQIAALAGGNA